MFKKSIMALTLALVMTASSALAADNGVYLGLKFIDALFSTGTPFRSQEVATFLDVKEYMQNTVGGSVFVGYDFYPTTDIPVRAELEYAIRSNADISWSGKRPVGRVRASGKWGLQTLFANAYWDFHNSSAFTPYIGAGLGLGFLNVEYSVDARTQAGFNVGGSVSEVQTVFAWNAGVGCSYAITDNLSADLAYRFVGLGYSSTDMSIAVLGQAHKFEVGMAPYTNEVSVGIRYTF